MPAPVTSIVSPSLSYTRLLLRYTPLRYVSLITHFDDQHGKPWKFFLSFFDRTKIPLHLFNVLMRCCQAESPGWVSPRQRRPAATDSGKLDWKCSSYPHRVPFPFLPRSLLYFSPLCNLASQEAAWLLCVDEGPPFCVPLANARSGTLTRY